jgi:hypothetical protein
MGDAQIGIHGATAIGWMTLEGTKSAGTRADAILLGVRGRQPGSLDGAARDRSHRDHLRQDEYALQLNASCSYWKSSRERITDQMVVWEGDARKEAARRRGA